MYYKTLENIFTDESVLRICDKRYRQTDTEIMISTSVENVEPIIFSPNNRRYLQLL